MGMGWLVIWSPGQIRMGYDDRVTGNGSGNFVVVKLKMPLIVSVYYSHEKLCHGRAVWFIDTCDRPQMSVLNAFEGFVLGDYSFNFP